MTQRTFDVEHEGTHYPTNAQLRRALNAVLKDEDVEVEGDVDYFLVENSSGGPSKVRATFDPKTKTVGGKKPAPKSDDSETGTETVGGDAKA